MLKTLFQIIVYRGAEYGRPISRRLLPQKQAEKVCARLRRDHPADADVSFALIPYRICTKPRKRQRQA